MFWNDFESNGLRDDVAVFAFVPNNENKKCWYCFIVETLCHQFKHFKWEEVYCTLYEAHSRNILFLFIINWWDCADTHQNYSHFMHLNGVMVSRETTRTLFEKISNKPFVRNLGIRKAKGATNHSIRFSIQFSWICKSSESFFKISKIAANL